MLFNQGELEECDSVPEDVLYMVRMDIKDGKITQKVMKLQVNMCSDYLVYGDFGKPNAFLFLDQSVNAPMVVYQNNKAM